MNSNTDGKRRWVFGLAAVALALGLGIALDLPGKLRDTPPEQKEPYAAILSGCQSSCEGKGSGAAFCLSYCGCILESLKEGRSEKELSAFLWATAKGPSAEQQSEMESKTEGCTELARSATSEDP